MKFMKAPWSRRPKWESILKEEGAQEKLQKRRGRKKDPMRVSVKYCGRCLKLYKTRARKSKYCDNCKKPGWLGHKFQNEVKDDK